MALYLDLLIENDDVALDADGLPQIVCDRESIAQDLCHAIRESGYLVAMVAERSADLRQLILQQIITLVEDDLRIVPGSASVVSSSSAPLAEQVYSITATTTEFGTLELSL
jgi:hypothetical protein